MRQNSSSGVGQEVLPSAAMLQRSRPASLLPHRSRAMRIKVTAAGQDGLLRTSVLLLAPHTHSSNDQPCDCIPNALETNCECVVICHVVAVRRQPQGARKTFAGAVWRGL